MAAPRPMAAPVSTLLSGRSIFVHPLSPVFRVKAVDIARLLPTPQTRCPLPRMSTKYVPAVECCCSTFAPTAMPYPQRHGSPRYDVAQSTTLVGSEPRKTLTRGP